MLGMIHRAVLGLGPVQLRQFFQPTGREADSRITRLSARRHSKQLDDMKAGHYLEVMRRSALGLRSVYNLLPGHVVSLSSVKEFQGCLQRIVQERAVAGQEDWKVTLSPSGRVLEASPPLSVKFLFR